MVECTHSEYQLRKVLEDPWGKDCQAADAPCLDPLRGLRHPFFAHSASGGGTCRLAPLFQSHPFFVTTQPGRSSTAIRFPPANDLLVLLDPCFSHWDLHAC